MPMNPEIKAKWVEALRSGKYEQGRMWLGNDNKFCCLGVLCEISGFKKKFELGVYGYIFPDGSHHSSLLSEDFRKEIGISPMEQKYLTHLNDEDIPFSFIAELIEKDL